MVRVGISGPIDRIQRGGGLVLVTAVGAISITAASGQAATMTANGGSVAVSAAGRVDANAASGQVVALQVAGNTKLYADASKVYVVAGNTLDVQGTGTHTFSGPVKVSTATSTSAFDHDGTSGSGAQRHFVIRRAGAIKGLIQTESTFDTTFYVATGAAGAETYTEALRLLNASGYAQFASRVGIGVSPSYPLHVSGNAYITGAVGIAATPDSAQGRLIVQSNDAGGPAGRFMHTTSATSPVVVVKLGSTPGAGGDAMQIQDSAGSALVKFSSGGNIQARYLTNVANGGAYLDMSTVSAPNTVSIIQRSAASVGVIVQGASGQTGNLQQWQNNAGTTLARVTASGEIATLGVEIGVRDAGDTTYYVSLTSGGVRWNAAGLIQTTVGAAGGASALPATPSKYLKVVDDAGTTLVVPAYAAA